VFSQLGIGNYFRNQKENLRWKISSGGMKNIWNKKIGKGLNKIEKAAEFSSR